MPSTGGAFIILTLLSHPLQGSVPHLNIKATVDNGETLESTKKSPAGFKGQGGEQGSDSGKEHLPKLNKATVRGGSPLTHKHTKTARGIHTWGWEQKRGTTRGKQTRSSITKKRRQYGLLYIMQHAHLLWISVVFE